MEFLIKFIDSVVGKSRSKLAGKKSYIVILLLVGYYVQCIFLTKTEPDQMVVNGYLVALGLTVRATAKRNKT